MGRTRGPIRSVGDGQIDFPAIFAKLAQYDYDGWAVLEWECCLKDSAAGAREGAERIANWIIPVASRAFDDFAATGVDTAANRKHWALSKTVLITGATGMVGSHVLKLALASDEVAKVIVYGRSSVDFEHEKMEEYLSPIFTQFPVDLLAKMGDVDHILFCVGVYTGPCHATYLERLRWIIRWNWPGNIWRQIQRGPLRYFLDKVRTAVRNRA